VVIHASAFAHLSFFFAAPNDHVFNHTMQGKNTTELLWRVIAYTGIPYNLEGACQLNLRCFILLHKKVIKHRRLESHREKTDGGARYECEQCLPVIHALVYRLTHPFTPHPAKNRGQGANSNEA